MRRCCRLRLNMQSKWQSAMIFHISLQESLILKTAEQMQALDSV